MNITNPQSLMKEPGFLAMGPVHERVIRDDEMERFEAEFRQAVKDRHPTATFRIEVRPHYDPLLNSVGDRLMVAFQVFH